MTGEVVPIVAAVAARSRRRIVRHFCDQGAIEPGHAIEFAPGSRMERRQFDRMRADDVIRQTAPGHYWMDLPALDARTQRRRRRIVPLVLLIAVGCALGYLLLHRI